VARLLAVVALVAALAAGGTAPAQNPLACVTGEVPAPPTPLPHYSASVRVAKGLREATGHVSVRFTPERATDRLVFRLWANAPFLRRDGSLLTVTNVRAGGATPRVRRPNPTTLVVERPIAAGETTVTSMTWRLRLSTNAHARQYGGRVARLASFLPLLAWDARRGWQTDPPSAIGWETWTSPTADFDVTVTAPPGQAVLATGQQQTRARWHARAVRDFALAVGRFDVLSANARAPGRVKVVVGVDPATPLSARQIITWARAALENHARRFGAYPWSTFTLVAMDMDRYSFEYPTLAFVSATDRTPREGTAHEIAHQWFYSLVGNNQARDPWLDEALATWAQARATNGLAGVIAQPLSEPVRNHLGQPMRFWDEFDIALFVEGVYVQGVQALRSLGEPAAVDCALRRYVADNAYGTAEPADLLRALETQFPDARRKLEAYGARF
jgi:Peptidase family M1 domain